MLSSMFLLCGCTTSTKSTVTSSPQDTSLSSTKLVDSGTGGGRDGSTRPARSTSSSAASDSNSVQVAGSKNPDTKTKGAKKMKFKFEDYDVKSPEIAQEKLAQLFPEGSSSSEFRSAMEQLGAKCDVSDALHGEKGSEMYCRYLAGSNPFVKSKWTVAVKIESGNSINGLRVTAGLMGT